MAYYKNIQRFIPPAMTLDVEQTAQEILLASDWTQTGDCGLTDDCKALFVTYRNAIRTIRKANPSNPTWPDVPTEAWS